MLFITVPPHWIKAPEDVEVMLGKPVNLDCLVGGTPKPDVEWSKADQKTPGKYHNIQNIMKNFR